MLDIVIRQASPEDLKAIVQVEQSAFPQDRWAPESSLATRMKLFPSGTIVASNSDYILGFSNGFPIGDFTTQDELSPDDAQLFDETGDVWLLRNVAVHTDSQRKGIGRQLIQHQLDLAIGAGARQMRFTATPDLDSFYLKLGFDKLREAQDFHGVPQSVWSMKLAA